MEYEMGLATHSLLKYVILLIMAFVGLTKPTYVESTKTQNFWCRVAVVTRRNPTHPRQRIL